MTSETEKENAAEIGLHQLWRAAFGAVVLLALVSSPALADEEGDRPQPEADLVVEEVVEDQPSEALQDQVNAANNPLADLILRHRAAHIVNQLKAEQSLRSQMQ